MKALKPYLFLLLVLSLVGCGQPPQDDHTRLGNYRGTITCGNFSDEINMTITKDTANYQVAFTSLAQNAVQIPLQEVTVKGDSISFELRSDYDTYAFNNVWANHDAQLQGTLSVDTVKVPYLLTRDQPTASTAPRKEDVQFSSHGRTVNGTIWYPENAPKKGLVLITSSGNADRSATRAEAMHFAQKGFTTFHYDKQGTGRTAGDWAAAAMEELLADDRAAILFFAQTTGLPLTSMGIKGSSQGAAKVPFLLQALPDLKYGVVVSCPGVSLLESDLNYWKNTHAANLGEDLGEAAVLQRQVFEFIAGNTTRAAVESAVAAAKVHPWFQEIWLPNLDEVQVDDKLNYTPIPYFEKTRQPVLILQGTADEIVPENSAEKLASALRKVPNTNFEVVLLPGANHSMYDVGKSDFPYWSKLHPAYFEKIEKWITTVNGGK
ncbi:MAG: hypothetical protein DA408_02830 [Bacteroidetes bacterium]|nr:MAG: hypothetical protein C7N36_22185 [Bacteroidota bacterium]PTM14534.1 MAG: hypothetical protein DA408_02830 [Bacteroidota bacterium]